MADNFIHTLGVGIVTFVGTNIDDLFLLALLFSNRSYPVGQVILGQFLGISAIIGVSYVSSLLGSLFIPRDYLNLLGLIPILFGLAKLIELWKTKDQKETQLRVMKSRSLSFAVAVLTFAAGGDNIAVYIPLFANASPVHLVGIIFVYLILTGIWCALALYLVSRKRIANYLDRAGQLIFPFIWIAVGVSILFAKNELHSSL